MPNEEYDMMDGIHPRAPTTNDHYGDNPMYGALKNTLRIGLININGLPTNNAHLKNEQIRHAINKYNFAITL